MVLERSTLGMRLTAAAMDHMPVAHSAAPLVTWLSVAMPMLVILGTLRSLTTRASSGPSSQDAMRSRASSLMALRAVLAVALGTPTTTLRARRSQAPALRQSAQARQQPPHHSTIAP